VLWRKVLEIERSAGTDADAGELGANLILFRAGRPERQHEIEIVEEVGLQHRIVDLRKIDRGCSRRRRLLEERRQWLRLVAGLDLGHAGEIGRAEELGPEDDD
jgi:hypothetical protein